jgi:hypothetical protein
MIILPEGTVHEWTKSRTGSEWAWLSNTLMAHCVSASVRGNDAMAEEWRTLSDLAWQHSLDAYDADAEHINEVNTWA